MGTGCQVLLPDAPARYTASRPEVALEALVLERQRELDVARRHAHRLATVYHEHTAAQPSSSVVKVVTGHDAIALPMKLFMVDDRFAVLPLQREPAGAVLIVHASSLVDALGNLFDGLWQRAIPLDPATAWSAAAESSPPDDVDRRLVALQLSGLTDQATARQLGVSYRTAQRRIAGLIEALGVHTRFQAGVQAAFRESRRSVD
ncbi:MAG: hypothetical protein GEU96_22965 [Propionibacteriales bacterium]|nr:hypothetical protein [Propionibacteriales bacterium]